MDVQRWLDISTDMLGCAAVPVNPAPTSRMSLSMDLGTPTTEQTTPCASHSSAMACAAALPPLPPTTNTMLSPHRSMRLTISLMLAPPRDVP